MSTFNGMVTVELPVEVAEFLIHHCTANMEVALDLLNPLGTVSLQLPEQSEVKGQHQKFQIIKAATERALR